MCTYTFYLLQGHYDATWRERNPSLFVFFPPLSKNAEKPPNTKANTRRTEEEETRITSGVQLLKDNSTQ